MKPADRAWLAIMGGGGLYEVAAFIRQDWELLSSAFDRYRSAHPIVAHAVVIYLGLHLLRRIPPKLDPLGRLGEVLRR